MKFYNVTSNEYYFVADSFNFKKDATFEIEIQSFENSSLIVALATSLTISRIPSIFDLVHGLQCSEALRYYGLQRSVLMKIDKNMTQKHSGTISYDDVLHPIILSCSDLNQSTGNNTQNFVNVSNETEFRLNFLLTLNFVNPPTFEESHQALFLIVPPTILSIYCLLFLSWIINWIFNFTLKNKFHLGLCVPFLITFIYMVLYTLEYKAIAQSKSTKPLSIAAECFRCFQHYSIIFTIGISMLWSQFIFPPSIGFQQYIFGYISVLYFIPGIVVHLKLRERGYFEFSIALMLFKIIEFIIFRICGCDKDNVKKSDVLFFAGMFFHLSALFYSFLFSISSPFRYILETAANWITLVVMAVFFYYFKLNMWNRNDYWFQHDADDIEIEIAEHSEESDNKPPNNWQEEKETETIRLPLQFDNNIQFL